MTLSSVFKKTKPGRQPFQPGQHGSHSSFALTRAMEIFMKYAVIAAAFLAVAMFASSMSQVTKAKQVFNAGHASIEQQIEAASK